MSAAEMWIMCWICDHTGRDRIKNNDVHDKFAVTLIQEKLVQHHLWWFDHILRKPPEAPVNNNILIHPAKNKKRQTLIESDMREDDKKRIERIKCTKRACFGYECLEDDSHIRTMN
jgi:hypothetical protein